MAAHVFFLIYQSCLNFYLANQRLFFNFYNVSMSYQKKKKKKLMFFQDKRVENLINKLM